MPKIPYTVDDFLVKTTLKEDTYLKGTLYFSSSLKIKGYFEGDIEGKGLLIIAKSSTTKGRIKASTIIIEGHFEGEIFAEEKVEALRGAYIQGVIHSPVFNMDDDVIFDGYCEIVKPMEKVGSDV